jgi:hypothetical protein
MVEMAMGIDNLPYFQFMAGNSGKDLVSITTWIDNNPLERCFATKNITVDHQGPNDNGFNNHFFTFPELMSTGFRVFEHSAHYSRSDQVFLFNPSNGVLRNSSFFMAEFPGSLFS